MRTKISLKQIAYIIAFIGLAVSTYLTITRYTNAPLACPETGILNCENVLTSQYSTLFGIPNSILGIVFFIGELLVIFRYFGRDEMVLFNGVGLAFVFYYMLAEYMLRSICIYCTTVHVSVILLLIISITQNAKRPTSS